MKASAAINIRREYADQPDQSRQVSALMALLKAQKESVSQSLQAGLTDSRATVQPDTEVFRV